ncbi:MAG: NADPH-dependent reductase [Candidatus Saccharibacteria bacterium]|nr:NADPH-dependent reductase [Candidatus Saccharibacteria bacterium]
MKLEIIIASTRPERLGDQVGTWIADFAKQHSDFEVEICDLAEINLPPLDEPLPPAMNQYTKDHTKAWATRIEAADAFIVVTPEYNLSMPPSLANAVDYLSREWKRKPIGFVGYGITGAIRAIQTEKLFFTTLNMMPIPYIVALNGVYKPAVQNVVIEAQHEKDATRLLTELQIWAEALKAVRDKHPL